MVHFSISHSNLTPLFVIAISGIVLVFSIQIVFPEPSEFYTGHLLLHAGGLVLATFITVLAVLAYRMMRSRRLLLIMIAFANFTLTEMLLLTWAFDPTLVILGSMRIWDLRDLLMFITLGLLALGTLRND